MKFVQRAASRLIARCQAALFQDGTGAQRDTFYFFEFPCDEWQAAPSGRRRDLMNILDRDYQRAWIDLG